MIAAPIFGYLGDRYSRKYEEFYQVSSIKLQMQSFTQAYNGVRHLHMEFNNVIGLFHDKLLALFGYEGSRGRRRSFLLDHCTNHHIRSICGRYSLQIFGSFLFRHSSRKVSATLEFDKIDSVFFTMIFTRTVDWAISLALRLPKLWDHGIGDSGWHLSLAQWPYYSSCSSFKTLLEENLKDLTSLLPVGGMISSRWLKSKWL